MIKRRMILLILVLPYLLLVRWTFLMAEKESSQLYFNLAVANLVSTIGVVFNLLAIYANGKKMPTRGLEDKSHVLITQRTRFIFLSDIIHLPQFRCSIGDLLIYVSFLLAGIVWCVFPNK